MSEYYPIKVQILEGSNAQIDHFVVDLSQYLGYEPPWRNDDVWWEDESKHILRSDIHTDDKSESMVDLTVLMVKWKLKGTIELEDEEE